MPRRLIIVVLAMLALWLVLRPRPLTPSSQIPTFGSAVYGSRPYSVPRIVDGCNFPPLPDAAKLVLLSAARGQAISTVAIGSQDIAVTTASVTVEPGDDPLYVVIVPGRAVIWRFTGATQRVHQLVLALNGALQIGGSQFLPVGGETGIAREKVVFMPGACVRAFATMNTVEASLAAGLIRNSVGRMPDVVAASEPVSNFAIPSGSVTVTDRSSLRWRLRERPLSLLEYLGFGLADRFASSLKRGMTERYPDGVVEIDPNDVVASGDVSRYEVLPDLAGLEQLVRDGSLQDMGSDEFHIKRKIRLPAELSTGGFLLLKGVPEPDGDPGMACIVSQETGQVLGSSKGRPLC